MVVDEFRAKIEPAVKDYGVESGLRCVGKPAHPEPHLYKDVDGIIGKDLVRKICIGQWEASECKPNIQTRKTIFGVIASGTCPNLRQ